MANTAQTSFADSKLVGAVGFYPIQFVWNDDKSRVTKIILHDNQDNTIFKLSPFEQFEQLDEIIVLEWRHIGNLDTSQLWQNMCGHLSVSDRDVTRVSDDCATAPCKINDRDVKLTRLSTFARGPLSDHASRLKKEYSELEEKRRRENEVARSRTSSAAGTQTRSGDAATDPKIQRQDGGKKRRSKRRQKRRLSTRRKCRKQAR